MLFILRNVFDLSASIFKIHLYNIIFTCKPLTVQNRTFLGIKKEKDNSFISSLVSVTVVAWYYFYLVTAFQDTLRVEL